ncbi:aminotransferase class I/II-fold pyridoxal phosphate-dependent enzyme [Streptomyces virginiae]|uniref:aminotransferase class I/II-fold pyridoxal phosphate-dependent enzyme n=1 Tax=Streptomyces TaxID=1883 RepID=UPI001F013464|nr:aminotransferase class I/II-fold pyridoxal phosphate-dependent enzyme [Streptomyces sp. SID1046]
MMQLDIPGITDVLSLIGSHDTRARRSINFTPSENVLSPLARVPFVSDLYARYFFDYFRTSFVSGLDAGRVQMEILEPILRQMARAEYVDVRPMSGMNCATIAIAGLCRSGQTMLTVPVEGGGHTSTAAIADRLGVRTLPVPMRDTHFVDVERLDRLLAAERPALVYFDQSSLLFPADPRTIREVIDRRSPRTVLYVDSSHTNGLILAGALPSPLDRGAHAFGGSTHKTLPGPHKGFVATNDPELRDRIASIAYHFVSQHHLAAAVSLAITLIEMRDCGGKEYASRVLENAQRFARGLSDRGIPVVRTEQGFTRCHQVWVLPPPGTDAAALSRRLYGQGLLVNLFPDLPGVSRPVFRMSMAEMTRWGGTEREVDDLVDIFAELLSAGRDDLRAEVADVKSRLAKPRYCYDYDQLAAMGVDSGLLSLFQRIEQNA